MLENVSMATPVNKETRSIQSIGAIPETEVRERAVRRRFTAAYKLRILKEAEICKEQGHLGALLRREGCTHPISSPGDVRSINPSHCRT